MNLSSQTVDDEIYFIEFSAISSAQINIFKHLLLKKTNAN